MIFNQKFSTSIQNEINKDFNEVNDQSQFEINEDELKEAIFEMNDDLITIPNHNKIDKLTNSNEIAKEQQEERMLKERIKVLTQTISQCDKSDDELLRETQRLQNDTTHKRQEIMKITDELMKTRNNVVEEMMKTHFKKNQYHRDLQKKQRLENEYHLQEERKKAQVERAKEYHNQLLEKESQLSNALLDIQFQLAKLQMMKHEMETHFNTLEENNKSLRIRLQETQNEINEDEKKIQQMKIHQKNLLKETFKLDKQTKRIETETTLMKIETNQIVLMKEANEQEADSLLNKLEKETQQINILEQQKDDLEDELISAEDNLELTIISN